MLASDVKGKTLLRLAVERRYTDAQPAEHATVREAHAVEALRERAQLREQHTPLKRCMSARSCACPTASGAAARIT